MTWPTLHLGDIARDDAIHQLGGVLARDQILVERRDVDERGRVADGVVLVLVMHLVHADARNIPTTRGNSGSGKAEMFFREMRFRSAKAAPSISASSVSSVVKNFLTTEDTEDAEETCSCWIICSLDRYRQLLKPLHLTRSHADTNYARQAIALPATISSATMSCVPLPTRC